MNDTPWRCDGKQTQNMQIGICLFYSVALSLIARRTCPFQQNNTGTGAMTAARAPQTNKAPGKPMFWIIGMAAWTIIATINQPKHTRGQ